MASKANAHYDWMKLTYGGSRKSVYQEPAKPKKKKQQTKGNIADVIRERSTRAMKY